MIVVNDVCLGAAVSWQEAGRRGGDPREGVGKGEAQGWVSQGARWDCWLRQGLSGTVGLGRVCPWCLSFQLHLHTQWPLSIQVYLTDVH